MIDLLHLFPLPHEWHEELRIFGTCDWIRTTHHAGAVDDIETDYAIDASWEALRAAGVSQRTIDFVTDAIAAGKDGPGPDFRGASVLLQMRALGVLLAQGPKVFRPTAEQFETCEHVDLHLPVADYRQPYECMVVEIPDECRRRLSAQSGLPLAECGHAVLTHHWKSGEVFTMLKFGVGLVPEYINLFAADFHASADLEAAVLRGQRKASWRVTPAEAAYCQAAVRAALNLNLMLVHFGHRDGGPINPEAYRRHRSRKRLARFSHADFHQVCLDRTIVLRKTRSAGSTGEPTGREVSPHWRRGHWRSQRHGVELRSIKLVFIAPVLVRQDRLSGDEGGSVTYVGK